MNELGVSKNSQAYKNLVYDLEQASAKYDQLVAAAQRMEADGSAYTVYAEYERLSSALEKLQGDYDRLAAKKAEIICRSCACRCGCSHRGDTEPPAG